MRGLYVSIAIGILGLIGAIYLALNQYGASAILTTPGLLFLAMIYGIYDYWRRPIRKAALYNDHLEISGREGGFRIPYSEVENLREVKNLTGRSKQSVTFSIKGKSFEFRIPYRKNNRKPDLFPWIQERITSSTHQNTQSANVS